MKENKRLATVAAERLHQVVAGLLYVDFSYKELEKAVKKVPHDSGLDGTIKAVLKTLCDRV